MMKTTFLFIVTITCVVLVNAQTNTFLTSGNVGIGTTSPSSQLNIKGGAVVLSDPGPTPYGFNVDMSNIFTGGWAREYSFSYNGTGKMFSMGVFANGGTMRWGYIGGNSSNGTVHDVPWMAFLPSGNVGIGTTNPQAKLDVNGALNASGGISSIISGTDIGGLISIQNPGKTTAGTASTWKIMNMSGWSGNSLQFWAYDNIGCSGGMCSNRFTLLDNGNVGIGTVDTKGYKLAVNGSAIFTKAVVKFYTAWPDYVFEKNYSLMSLDSVESFVTTNKHLPNVPSAESISKNGLDLGENQKVLLEKTEELTLYLIDQNKIVKDQSEKIKSLQTEMEELKNLILKLTNENR